MDYLPQQELSLQDLLKIEDTPDLLGICCPDTEIPVWAFMRNVVLRLVMSDLLYKSNPLIDTFATSNNVANKSLTVFRAIRNRLTSSVPQCPVLIYGSGIGYFSRNSRLFNRLTGYFAERLGHASLLIEGISGISVQGDRENSRIASEVPDIAKGYLLGRFRGRHSRYLTPARELVNVIETHAVKLFGWQLGDKRRDWLVHICARNLASNNSRQVSVERFLSHTNARLLLVEEGCYGYRAVLNATARKHGLTIAEFQHGMVSKGHDVYNISQKLLDNPSFRQTLPTHFLGYGKWWLNQFNMPLDKLVVGNAHRTALLRNYRRTQEEKNIILVLGDGIDTRMYLDFCKELANAVPKDFRVMFRPHPLEYARLQSLIRDEVKGYEVDLELDIFLSLSHAYAVVSEISTGLFEAVGLSDRIFVWNTAKSRFGLPEHPFYSIDTAEELSQKLLDTYVAPMAEDDSEEIWASNWENRFDSFVGNFLN